MELLGRGGVQSPRRGIAGSRCALETTASGVSSLRTPVFALLELVSSETLFLPVEGRFGAASRVSVECDLEVELSVLPDRRDCSPLCVEDLFTNFFHGLSFGDNDQIAMAGWFEILAFGDLMDTGGFRLRPALLFLSLRGGESVISSVSISISGASLKRVAALVNAALYGVDSVWSSVGAGCEWMSSSMTASGSASRSRMAALVNVLTLEEAGAARFPARRDRFSVLFFRNISSREGRYGEDEDTVSCEVLARGGEDMKTLLEDMVRRVWKVNAAPRPQQQTRWIGRLKSMRNGHNA